MNAIKFNNLQNLIDIIFDKVNIVIDIKKEDITDIYRLSNFIRLDDSIRNFISFESYHKHNLLNKTYGKKKVPTICEHNHIFDSIIYCPNCGKNHKNVDYSGTIIRVTEEDVFYYRSYDMRIKSIDTITCLECNSVYNLEDMKILKRGKEHVYGKMFIDENKISLSYKYMYSDINRYGNFYYQDGSIKVTFDTVRGYSYTTTRGHAYKILKQTWERYDAVAPTFFNSTYAMYDGAENIFFNIAECEIIDNYKKMTKEELIKAFSQDTNSFNSKQTLDREAQLIQQCAEELYNQVQQHYSYKLPEDVKKPQSHTRNMVRIFKNFNRYVNLDPHSSTVETLIDKYYNLKKNKLTRDEVNVIDKLFKLEKVKIGKKTRALVQQNLYNKSLFDSIPVLLRFKNTSNINNLVVKMLEHGSSYRYFYSTDVSNAIELWKNFRDENYITAKFIEDLEYHSVSVSSTVPRQIKTTKLSLMIDIYRTYNQIKSNIPEFDILDFITFENEQQLHDELVRYTNSDEYFDIINKKRVERVFTLEDEIFKIEEVENNIFVARNGGELHKIGRKMNICVGGYSNAVDRGHCRIVYLMDNENNEYKACLELRKIQLKKSIKYKLVQAKLKYNRLPCEDIDIYNKIIKWTNDHDIEIETYDMEMPIEKEEVKVQINAM